MNSRTKEYLTDKFKQGRITFDSKFKLYKLNDKIKIVDQQGKNFNIVGALCDIKPDKCQDNKEGCIYFCYKKGKMYYSIWLKETNQ